MFNLASKAIPILITLAIAELSTLPLQAQTISDNSDILIQIEQYSQEGNLGSIEQITNVNQLQDLSPADWSYEALRGLVERYGCISGFPDGTYKGDRPITRNEFAAGLNSCFEQIERSLHPVERSLNKEN